MPYHQKAFAEGTRYNYRKHLDLLKSRLGGGPLVDLDQEAVEIYSAEIAREHGDSAADDQISMISNLWQFAKGFPEFKRKGRINPTSRITRPTNTTARVIWSGRRKSSSRSIPVPGRGCNLCASACTTPVSAAATSSR